MSFYVDGDIREIVERLGAESQAFAGRRVLLCGGLGFLGRYFLAVFQYLNQRVLRRPCELLVVDNGITSGAAAAAVRPDGYRYLAHDIIQPLPELPPLDFIIHAAGIASPYYDRKHPLETLEVATVGTRNLLMMSRQHRLQGLARDEAAGEIRQNPVVRLLHPRAVDVERADDGRRHAVQLVENHAERFAQAFGFVVAGARAQARDVAIVGFRRGHVRGVRVAVDFARAEKQQPLQPVLPAHHQ